jgi:GxxExxY protein
MSDEIRLREISGAIIGAAMEVHNELRPGQDERIYENALAVELGLRGLRFDQQRQYAVKYKSVPIGTFIPDFVVEDLIIVDPKVVTEFNDAHIAQMLGYLAITNLSLALLFNFKHAKLEWKRVVAPRPLTSSV